MFSQKATLFNLCPQQRLGAVPPFHQAIQLQGTFVLIAHYTYDAELNSLQNIVYLTNYTDNFWNQCVHTIAKVPVSAFFLVQWLFRSDFCYGLCSSNPQILWMALRNGTKVNAMQTDEVTRIKPTRIHTNVAITISKYRKSIQNPYRNNKYAARQWFDDDVQNAELCENCFDKSNCNVCHLEAFLFLLIYAPREDQPFMYCVPTTSASRTKPFVAILPTAL